MKLNVFSKRKKISLDVHEAGFFRKGLGLVFRTRNTPNLLFDFGRRVTWQGNLTSLFVFFPFLAIWLDDKGRVIDKRIIKPFLVTIKQKKEFYKIIELPINLSNEKTIIQFIGLKEFNRYFR